MSAKVILATASYDHSIKFWEAPSGISYRTIQHTTSQINRMQISPDKTKLIAGCNPHIKLFEVESSNSSALASCEGHSSNVTDLGFGKDGTWAYSSSEDKTVKIWDLRAPRCQRDYDCNVAVNTVVMHPNQKELICGLQNGTIRVWDIAENKCTQDLVPGGDVAIRSLSIATDGSQISAANSKGLCFVWQLGKDCSSFKPIHKFAPHNTYILRVLYSPDTKYLATTSADKTITIHNVQKNYELEKTLEGHKRWVWDCVFSGESQYLVTASSDHVARLWDLKTGETVRHYTGHRKAVTCVTLAY